MSYCPITPTLTQLHYAMLVPLAASLPFIQEKLHEVGRDMYKDDERLSRPPERALEMQAAGASLRKIAAQLGGYGTVRERLRRQ